MGPEHVYLHKEQGTYSFDSRHDPVARVQSGTFVHFETYDCFTDQIQSERDLVSSIDFSRVNPATGPVFVERADPGTVLKVDILGIQVRNWGVVATLPGMGTLFHTVDGLRTRIVPVEDSQMARFNDQIRFPVTPMIGVIGVAPSGEGVACGHPGDHGGNIDTHVITKGSTVYFPVFHEGALFGLGDVHASMGDGEICGTGIEISGGVDTCLSVLSDVQIPRPVVETADSWFCVASAGDVETSIRLCSEDMQRLLVNRWGLDMTDAYLLMSIAGDVQVCQACKPCPVDVITRFRMPKLAGLPGLI